MAPSKIIACTLTVLIALPSVCFAQGAFESGTRRRAEEAWTSEAVCTGTGRTPAQ